MTIMRKIYPFAFLFILLVMGCEDNSPDIVFRCKHVLIATLRFVLGSFVIRVSLKISEYALTVEGVSQ